MRLDEAAQKIYSKTISNTLKKRIQSQLKLETITSNDVCYSPFFVVQNFGMPKKKLEKKQNFHMCVLTVRGEQYQTNRAGTIFLKKDGKTVVRYTGINWFNQIILQ